MERLSISLNDKSSAILKKYAEKYTTTQADIIRRSLQYFDTIEEATEKIGLDTILTYVDFLANQEHLIIDIAHWKTILTQIGEGTKKFWDEIYKIGCFHRKEYADKGIQEPEQIFKYIEKANWFTLKKDSKNSFTLVLTVSESARFIKTFFEGFFSEYPQKVDIQEEYMKIRIKFN